MWQPPACGLPAGPNAGNATKFEPGVGLPENMDFCGFESLFDVASGRSDARGSAGCRASPSSMAALRMLLGSDREVSRLLE